MTPRNFFAVEKEFFRTVGVLSWLQSFMPSHPSRMMSYRVYVLMHFLFAWNMLKTVEGNFLVFTLFKKLHLICFPQETIIRWGADDNIVEAKNHVAYTSRHATQAHKGWKSWLFKWRTEVENFEDPSISYVNETGTTLTIAGVVHVLKYKEHSLFYIANKKNKARFVDEFGGKLA